MFKSLLPEGPGTLPLADAFRACRAHFLWAAGFSALVNLLYLTPTLYMMQVYDRVVPTGGLTTLAFLTVIAVLALGALSGLDWIRGRLLLRAGLRLDRLLSARVLARVTDREGPAPGVQVLREFDNVRAAVAGQGALALFDAPWTPIYLLCCFLLHPAIGVLTLVGGTVLVALAVANERDSRPRLSRAIQAANTAYAAQEAIAGQAEVVRALGMREASIARQVGQRHEAVARQADAQLTGGRYSGAIKFVRLTLQSLALGMAALLAVRGQLSPGAIIASSVLLSRAVAPIELLVGAWPGLVQARASWRSLIELFSTTASQDAVRTALPDPVGRVTLESVSMRYGGSDTVQLRQVSLSVSPGEVLGVIGASGSGKTTLARILAGGVRPTGGVIRLDGAAYEARPGDDLARHIGYLPQTPSLFAGTIKDNIARFVSTVEQDSGQVDRDAVAAAQAAGAHDMILRLPHGYDTALGPFGAGLSAGQAQRVALARAMFRDPVLLVLDEPNSNLDQEGETALLAAVRRAAARGAAVVVVAHRAGVLAQVDRLLMMADGSVQIEGPRESVLERLRQASVKASSAA